jgi:hypothetical protein
VVGVTIVSGALTVTEGDVVDAAPAPAALTARIATVYAVPLTKPVIAIGDAVVPVWRFEKDPPFNEYW